MNKELENIYRNRFHNSERQRDAVWKVLVERFFQRWIQPDATVLDLGAGYCTFINNVKAGRRYALDLNPDTLQFAAEGVRVLKHDATEAWPVGDVSVDVVFTSNFLEHLPSKANLLSCLHEAYRVLRTGGTLLALGPNVRFCGDVYWDFFDHYLPLSDRSVAEALQLAGFNVEQIIPRFLPYTMKSKLPPSPILLRAYLSIPAAWRLLGKQFLVVARKVSA
jgi:SAM-dependent methyltransferase